VLKLGEFPERANSGPTKHRGVLALDEIISPITEFIFEQSYGPNHSLDRREHS
jgi:hypothetical protein